MITADQLVAHLVGDYILQSDWMANRKTTRLWVALVHAFTYALPFLFFKPSLAAFLVIWLTHAVIDRWRLARFVCWVKNFISPRADDYSPRTYMETVWWHPWVECMGTGYHSSRPPWLAVWLLIIADNTMHIIINGLALAYL